MRAITRKFIRVTDHYGYQFRSSTQIRQDECVFVVCRVDDRGRDISGFYSRKEAMKCCYYLEGLNYGKEIANENS